MSRPSYTYAGAGSKFSFKLPPGWFAMVTCLSRKKYDQGMLVSFEFMGDLNEAVFYSPAKESNEQMKNTFNDRNSLPIVPQDEEMEVALQFYASPKTQVPKGDTLVDKNMDVNRIHILQTEKTPGSFDGADTMTFFVFVEDTSTSGMDAGNYDDAVGFIHLLKKE